MITLKKLKQLKTLWKFLDAIRKGRNEIRKNPEKALDYFNYAVEVSSQIPPKNEKEIAEAHYLKGYMCTRFYEMEEAFKHFNYSISLDDTFHPVFNERGMIHLQKKQYDLAKADFEKAIALNSSYKFAYHNLGKVFRAKGDYQQALALFNKTLKLNQTYNFAEYQKAICYYQMGNYSACLKSYDKAIRNPQGMFRQHLKLLEYLKGKQRFEKEFYFSELKNRRTQETFEDRMQVISSIKNIHIEMKKGLKLFTEKQYQTAMQHFENVLKIDDKLGLVCFYIGVCLVQLENQAQANDYFARAESLGFEEGRAMIQESRILEFQNLLNKVLNS